MRATPTNDARREAASTALEVYRDAKGLAEATLLSKAETLTDLLTDLRHYAAAERIDFQAAVDMSEFHYEEESS